MKRIYLTEEGKKAIEDKIAEMEKADLFYKKNASAFNPNYAYNSAELKIYKEILESAIILPVEKSWENVIDIHDPEGICNKYYPNGVIVQPKQ